MKKTLALVTALALAFVSVNASAQAPKENVLFENWSVGLGLDPAIHGGSITVATTILPNLQARVVYTSMSPYVLIANPIVKGQFGDKVTSLSPLAAHISNVNIHSTSPKVDVTDIYVDGAIHERTISLLADFFPSPKSSFHLTGGVIFNLHPQLLKATITAKNGTQPAIDPSNYAQTEFFGLTTDPEGKFHIGAQYGANVVQPYLGIGFGHPVLDRQRVNVNFDLGVSYVGGMHLMSKNYYNDPNKPVNVELNQAWIDANPDVKNAMGDSYAQSVRILNVVNSFPIMPYMRITLVVNLF